MSKEVEKEHNLKQERELKEYDLDTLTSIGIQVSKELDDMLIKMIQSEHNHNSDNSEKIITVSENEVNATKL
jgi:hypothetical protein